MWLICSQRLQTYMGGRHRRTRCAHGRRRALPARRLVRARRDVACRAVSACSQTSGKTSERNWAITNRETKLKVTGRSTTPRTHASTRDSTIGGAAPSAPPHSGCSMCRFWSRYRTLSETPPSPDPSIARSLTCSRAARMDVSRVLAEVRRERHLEGTGGRGCGRAAAPCPRWRARSVRPSHRPRAARRPPPAARAAGAAPAWSKAV